MSARPCQHLLSRCSSEDRTGCSETELWKHKPGPVLEAATLLSGAMEAKGGHRDHWGHWGRSSRPDSAASRRLMGSNKQLHCNVSLMMKPELEADWFRTEAQSKQNLSLSIDTPLPDRTPCLPWRRSAAC